MGKFLSYYKGQVGLFVADIACSLAVAGIDLAFPQVLRTCTRGIFGEGADAIMGALVYLAVGLALMYLVRFGCRYFVCFWGHVMGARMESRMREDLFDAYERMSFSFFDRNKSGDLMSRLVSDLFDIAETAHHGPEFLIIGVVEIVGSFVILGSINATLTLVLAVICAALIAYNAWANLRMKAVFAENRIKISGVNSRLEDSLAGSRVVKSFAAEDLERRKFRDSNDAYLDSKTRMYRAMGQYQAAISAMMGGLNTVILVMGGWLIAKGQMEAADLATYALYISMFTTPITNILNFTETFQKAIAGFRRFCDVLDTRPDIEDKPGAPDLAVSEGAICYQDVPEDPTLGAAQRAGGVSQVLVKGLEGASGRAVHEREAHHHGGEDGRVPDHGELDAKGLEQPGTNHALGAKDPQQQVAHDGGRQHQRQRQDDVERALDQARGAGHHVCQEDAQEVHHDGGRRRYAHRVVEGIPVHASFSP